VWLDRGTGTDLVARIAERFNGALATGRFDQHFAAE
jgi:hypothetical protein